jgi:hypothetical protein
MKHKAGTAILLILSIFLLLINTGCNLLITLLNELEDEATHISITPSQVILYPGDTIQFTVDYVNVEEMLNTNVTNEAYWESSNAAIVNISSSGYARALSEGVATISARYNDFTGTATVTVTKDQPPVNVVYFEKPDWADPTLPENQDRITDTVWITRGDTLGLYNAYSEEGYYSYYSPQDTEWASGPTSYHNVEDYKDWETVMGACPSCYLNQIVSLHIIPDDRWFDVEFLSWTEDGYGGGFAYNRTEVSPPGTFSGIYFSKPDYTDPFLPENQDWITDTVWITRNDSLGLFNAYSEAMYIYSISPANTEWALGTTDTNSFIEYTDWETAVGSCPSCYLNETISLHIISEDIWFDIVFTSWTEDGYGGGFAYYRLEVNPPADYPPPGIFFTKEEYADPYIEENQDRFTPTVWISRGDTQGLFNVYSEESYMSYSSPADTEWAPGSTSSHILSDYTDWETALYSCPQCYKNQVISLHVISADLWFDVFFLKWTEGENAGGFRYYREQVDPPSGSGSVYFEKYDYTDPYQETNQDRITPSVWISRDEFGGIFNAYYESSYSSFYSPAYTEWAVGITSSQSPGNYTNWDTAIAECPSCNVGITLSLHVMPEDLWFDIVFISWTDDGNGGGFAYSRIEVPPPLL